METFKNFSMYFGLTGVFNTKTSEEWYESDYQAKHGELLFSVDKIDPEDPDTWIVRAKIGVGEGRTWNELPYWKVGESDETKYRPVKILTASDFVGSDYINPDWSGLTHYQVLYKGNRLTNEITKHPEGGFSLNAGFGFYDNELMVIF